MAARNSAGGFGWVTRALHWVTAILVLSTIPLGLWIARIEPSLATLKYFGLHKTLGITVLTLTLIRILWHRVSPPPPPVSSGSLWQDRAARAVHLAFYLLLVAIPLTGWIASSATGIGTVVFNRWTLPSIAPVSEAWESAFFTLHTFLAQIFAALIALHVAAALHRGLAKRDGTLRRMVRGG